MASRLSLSFVFILSAFFLTSDFTIAKAAPGGYVAATDWSRFTPAANPNDSDAIKSRDLLLKACKYNLGWLNTFSTDGNGLYVISSYVADDLGEGPRHPAEAAMAIAVAVMTGIYDPAVIGVSQTVATGRAVKMIKSIAYWHRYRIPSGWGDSWQSALWAAYAGQAGWMLWSSLDTTYRDYVAGMVEYEANRFNNYDVPYYKDRNGNVIYTGDSKAEENSWNASLMQIAVSMMPAHPNISTWKSKCCELMVSAYARPSDVNRTTTVDGKTLTSWLNGSNAEENGVVVNHDLIHDDYMATIQFNLRSYLAFSLAQINIPQSARFNSDIVYDALVDLNFSAPPFQFPGGTMYVSGSEALYYPTGTDWSRYRFDIFYCVDAFTRLLGLDTLASTGGLAWERLRATRLQTMQARHTDGHIYGAGEWDNYSGKEQLAAQQLADAYLLKWLISQGGLSPVASWNLGSEILTVNSFNPGSGVSITVSPNDNNAQGSGISSFTRTYNDNTVVTVTAPSAAGGNSFQKWQRDGEDWSTSLSTTVTMDGAHTMTAVYLTPVYPSGPQITKDGTTVILQNYASLPLSSRTTSTYPPPINFANQLGRVNFLRSEPTGASLSSSRFFVCDNNRNLYILHKTTRGFTAYINFEAVFGKFDNDPGFAGGLVTFQFDPEYAANGKFYTVHTEDPAKSGSDTPVNTSLPGFQTDGYTTTAVVNPPAGAVARQGVLIEWTDTNIDNATFEGTARELLRIGFNGNLHPMGDLLFNPLAGLGHADYLNLYVAVGDGGGGEIPSTRAIPQRLDALQGKVLRITPAIGLRPSDQMSANGRYRIPTTGTDPNPFVSLTLSGLQKEIFAYGFRNCHRLSWDSVSNRIIEHDIGLHSWEEVNIIHKGANYGYAEREGNEQLFIGGANDGKTGSQISPPVAFPNPDSLTVTGVGPVPPRYPVALYSHRDGDGIASGFVYRGSSVPQLYGKYVFGDITTARLFYCDLAEMVANDDGARSTVATVHEIQIVFNGAQRRLFDIIAAEYRNKGGTASATLPGGALATSGSDIDGIPYGGGRADIRLALGGDGEIYMLSKSDGMIRSLSGSSPRTLTVDSSNPGSGVSIIVSPTDNNNEGDGATSFARVYNNNTQVTLTAPAVAGGNNFARWRRNGVEWSTTLSTTVTLDADHTMTAVYVVPPPPTTHTLTVDSSNPGSGVSITVSLPDNNLESDGTTPFTRIYNDNTQVTLTAPANVGGNNFEKWRRNGADWSTTLSTTVTLDAAYTMTAVYVAPPPTIRTLTVNSSSPNSGVLVTISPNDNNAQGSGATSFTRIYNDSTVVTLTAPSSAGGNNFQKWQRDGADWSTTLSTAVTLDAAHTMTVVYVAPPPTIRTLTVNSSSPNSGVLVTISPNDNNAQGSGATSFTRIYNDSTVVTLTAPSSAGGNNFQKWQRDGADWSTTLSTAVTLDAAHTMTVVYVAPPPTIRTLTVNSSSPGSGVSVTISPNDNNAQSSGATSFTRTYNNNTVVTLTAPASAGGNSFQKWQRDGADWSTSLSTTVTMDAARTMTVVYAAAVKVDGNNASVTYSGAVNDYTGSQWYNNTMRLVNAVNGYAQFSFTGTSIKWIGMKQFNLGIAAVYIDGALAQAGIDTYGPGTVNGVELFSRTGLANALHTIKVVETGQKNASSTGPRIPVDYFEYSNSSPPPPVVRALTVASSNPSSGVSVTVSPNDNNAQGNGSTSFTRSYNNNTVVTLTAPVSAGGNNFQKWQRDGVDWGTSLSTTVTMDAAHTMTAVYVVPSTTRTLTVNSSNPNSGVSIAVSPNDNNAQGGGATSFTRTYNNNTVVTLTAPVSAGGNNFQKWQRDGVDWGTSLSTTVTMDAAHTMTVVYVVPSTTRTLTVNSSNPNSGVSIAVSPNDNTAQGGGATSFTRTYNNNTVVTLTAPVSAGGNNFQKWQRDGVDWSTSLSTTVTMDAAHTMTTVYVVPSTTRTLTVTSSNPNSGVSIAVSPNDNTAQGGGATSFTRTYNNNTVVTLTAPVSAGGNSFQKWQRDGVDWSTSLSTTVTMDAAHTMTVVYVVPSTTRTLTVNSSNPNSGISIAVSPNDNTAQGGGATPFTRTYNNNTVVTLTAPVSAGGNNFQKWQRDGVDWSTSLSTTVTMNAAHTMTAVYVVAPPASAQATFVKKDTTTKGSWKGIYGADGYNIITHAVNYPSYATVAPSGKTDHIWASSTSDVRALQKPASSTVRIAAGWYSTTSFTVDLNLTDGKKHRVALYCVDWDTTARAETIQILNASNNSVLSSQSVTAFNGGQYLVWDIQGRVLIRLTRTGAHNAVLNGIFFDQAPAAVAALSSSAVGFSSDPQAKIHSSRISNGRFEASLKRDPHQGYLIQASTDMVDWVELSDGLTGGGLIDPEAGRFKQRFYRLMSRDKVPREDNYLEAK